MKKNILRSLEPQTRSLFRFKNSDTKVKAVKVAPTGEQDSDPTISTTIFVTH